MKKKGLTLLICIFFLSSQVFAQPSLNKTELTVSKKQLLHPPPVPYFFITGLCFGDTTRFTNQTDIGTVRWSITNDKGDTIYRATGNTTAYYFKKRGAYKVCLTADNGHLATKIRTVMVDTITKADLSFRYCYNVLDNLSACSDQYVWVLPDGTTTTTDFPAYQFTNPGLYPIKLVAIKGNKTDTLVKSIYVRGDSLGPPKANFTFKKIGNPAIYEFKAVDSLADNYSWYFGDHVNDDTSGYKVIHAIDLEAYDSDVELFISNGCGFASYGFDPIHTTAIQEESFSEKNVTVYPNPVTDEMNVLISDLEGKNYSTIKLMDVNGKTINELKPTGSLQHYGATFHTQQLSSGIYFIEITTGENTVHKKIVIQH